MFVLYSVALVMWIYNMYAKRTTTLKIHYLMAGLLTAKALTVLSQSGMYHLIRTTGGPDGWNIAYYVFTFLRGIMLFVVIVLIGTGWSFLKPFLADKEKKVRVRGWVARASVSVEAVHHSEARVCSMGSCDGKNSRQCTIQDVSRLGSRQLLHPAGSKGAVACRESLSLLLPQCWEATGV